MTDQIEALERLNKLKLNGTLTDEEFNVQKAAILAGAPALDATEAPAIAPRSGRLWLAGFTSIVALCVAGGVYYLYHSRSPSQQMPGLPGVEATSPSDAAQSTPPPQTSSSAVAANTSEVSQTAVIQPPQEFQDLCVSSSIGNGYKDKDREGYKLHRLIEDQERMGRKIQWEASGDNWILRDTWHDDLSRADHSVSILLVKEPSASPSGSCDSNTPGVIVTRMTFDNEELTGHDFATIYANLARTYFDKDQTSEQSKPSSDKKSDVQ